MSGYYAGFALGGVINKLWGNSREFPSLLLGIVVAIGLAAFALWIILEKRASYTNKADAPKETKAKGETSVAVPSTSKAHSIEAPNERESWNYGCKKHKLTFEEYWEEMNDIIEDENPCPKCLKSLLNMAKERR